MLTKNKLIQIGEGANTFQFYVKDIKVPMSVINNKNKKVLKQISIKTDGATVKSNEYASNADKIDITLTQFGTKEQNERVFEQTQSEGDVIRIGSRKDCQWVISNCQWEVAAEIGFLKDEGWYIS